MDLMIPNENPDIQILPPVARVPEGQLERECAVVREMIQRAEEANIWPEVHRTYRAMREEGASIVLACAAIYELYFEDCHKKDEHEYRRNE